MKFSFVSSCQSALTLELGMGAHVRLLPSELGPHLGWTCVGPVQAATVCPCFCESALLCPEGTVSMVMSLPSGFYNLPTASSTELSLEGGSLMVTSYLGPDVRRSLSLCICQTDFKQLTRTVSAHLPISGWCRTWLNKYKEMKGEGRKENLTSYPECGDGPITGELLWLLFRKLVTYFNCCDQVRGNKPSEGGVVPFGPGFEAYMP